MRSCLTHAPRQRGVASLLGGLLVLGGCKDLTGSAVLPAGVNNPAFYNNASGAIAMRNAAVLTLEGTIPEVIVETGLLTDELENPETGASAGQLLSSSNISPLDERDVYTATFVSLSHGNDSYAPLQRVRATTYQALGALAAYDTAKSDTATAKVLRGELYAFLGYDEILLADIYCSGVPLSTLIFQGTFRYAASSTTAQVYQDAMAKLDTALILGRGSDSLLSLARVLQGRAQLALGNYDAAADDVSTVPDRFTYQLFIGFSIYYNNNIPTGPDYSQVGIVGLVYNEVATISDREGINGLPFLSSGDPRTQAVPLSVKDITTGQTLYFPAKYSVALTSPYYAPFTVASGVEARLIQAEAALRDNKIATWLTTLNALRANAAVNTHGVVPMLPATLTDPGATITDPTAAFKARLALQFQERAYWLFLDGHRQGDLRRLLRQDRVEYPSDAAVYPTGHYLAPGDLSYGHDVTVPIVGESPNPLFHGCLDQNP